MMRGCYGKRRNGWTNCVADFMGVQLYVGGYSATIQGERARLAGYRCFSAVHRLRDWEPLSNVSALLDSGAFSDPPENRLSPAGALDRQLCWERQARNECGAIGWRAEAIVSYDRLIDEVWAGGIRHKQRWTVKAADAAVEETVEAARYLAARRRDLEPRRLVLSCQGVEAAQYFGCVQEVLQVATPNDWIGFGGWCILGRWKSWLHEFFRTIHLCLPEIAAAHIGRVHLFGCIWPPALGGLLWLADQYGITVSTDSAAPLLACAWKNSKKAGARCDNWRANVNWWQNTLLNLRDSPYYHEPPNPKKHTQMELF